MIYIPANYEPQSANLCNGLFTMDSKCQVPQHLLSEGCAGLIMCVMFFSVNDFCN